MKILRSDLLQWQRATDVPHNRRFGELTLKMMGWTESSKVATLVKGCKLNIKASEVAILAAFCIHMLRKYPLPLHQSSMLAAGEALMDYL